MYLLDDSSSDFRATYEHERKRLVTRRSEPRTITEEDLVNLPRLVATYLRRAGAIGKPQIANFRARWSGQMKRGKRARWMPVHFEQSNFFGEPARLFLMNASLFGIPFQAFHRYVGTTATMQVRVAGLFDVVDARGPEMDQSETVTFFNDICLLAPAVLIDANATWREVDAHTARATFSNGGHSISADLSFDANGDLSNFTSNDRYQSADGKKYTLFPWHTPVGSYRDFGGRRLPTRGDAIWKELDGDFVYGRFELEQIEYNLR